ncbi:MAG: bifunctional oligoribonuclease/PAP phosphatase NrnA [Melioribacteraceae bacterium]|nr:bifunctional oligoribonuclease/PAP phosphatase NrnA [Melioribacteraceae bacterium]
MEINFQKLKEIILENDSFLITSHVNPDADAIGSEIAFYHLLKKLGKTARIVNHSETPYNIEFLDPQKVIELYNDEKHRHLFLDSDVLVALDFNDSKRILSMQDGFNKSGKLKICIDHHQDPKEFVDFIFYDTGYSSTGEILYDFIAKSKIADFDFDIALPLYTAILTDTGSFQYERTTPKTHKIAAHLLELGVNPTEVYDLHYNQGTMSRINLLGKALESMQMNEKKNLAYMVITLDEIKTTGAVMADIDGFVNYCLKISGIILGILFVQSEDGVKMSFRSKGDITANKLASEFGGGGHINAAGARVFNVPFSETIQTVLKSAEKYV